ncbi:TetR family transcriptional regulator [Alkaliphilus transvaalensis]|uniref:TetR family transcriptional regulator n=1 Tax=Alkaliphilus transvaalensis TaxID=114628 RepID=UPI00068637FC|nr:TetR family transcriptional regulator [Alkaliphilus transvaalensis]
MNQSLDVKKNIQKSAKRLFALNSYKATSTRDIVREAGVNISAITYHFGSKEGLFLSLFNDFLFLEDEASVFVGNPVLELKKLLTRIIGLRFEDPELVTILQQEIVVHSTRTEAVKERLIPIWQRIHLLLEQGREAGDFHL